jgi:hypothetical protein
MVRVHLHSCFPARVFAQTRAHWCALRLQMLWLCALCRVQALVLDVDGTFTGYQAPVSVISDYASLALPSPFCYPMNQWGGYVCPRTTLRNTVLLNKTVRCTGRRKARWLSSLAFMSHPSHHPCIAHVWSCTAGRSNQEGSGTHSHHTHRPLGAGAAQPDLRCYRVRLVCTALQACSPGLDQFCGIVASFALCAPYCVCA